MTKKTKVLNVRLPDNLVKVLDRFVEKSNYRSRSEAIRQFAREYVLDHKGENNAG